MSLFIPHKKFYASLLLVLFFSILLLYFLMIPPSPTSQHKIILIKKGTSLKMAATLLKQEGMIRNRAFFIGMATLLGKKGKIKAGEYEFHTRMLPLEVLDALVKGQVKRHLVTIPEGYTLFQIAELLGELGIVEKGVFLEKATSPSLIASLGLSDHFPDPIDGVQKKEVWTLEGYLFPDTYHLYKEMDAEEVIRMMTQQFRKIFGPDLVDKASQIGFSPRQAVILASIIEKETPMAEEKPLISAVFHNRLKKKIPLQSDPTVIYGIRNFDGNLKKEHLQTPSPYNTYLNVGLPPTPICNPGKESLLAALSPSPSSYLYFVSKNDGSHHFSQSYEEHQQAVWKYQKRPLKR